MVRSCCAINCTTKDVRETRDKEVKFYRIPQVEAKRTLWLNAIKRKDFKPGPEAVICSQHFFGGKFSVSIPVLNYLIACSLPIPSAVCY